MINVIIKYPYIRLLYISAPGAVGLNAMIGWIIKRVSRLIDKQEIDNALLPYTAGLSTVLTIVVVVLVLGAFVGVAGFEHNAPFIDLGTFKSPIQFAAEDKWYLIIEKIFPNVSNIGMFLFGAIIGVYGIAYSLLSYNQAKKVEKQIRGTISTFAEFIEHATDILEETLSAEKEKPTRRKVVLVLMFPYYGILRDLEDVEAEMHRSLYELRSSSCETKMIIPNNPFSFGFQLFSKAHIQGVPTSRDVNYNSLIADMDDLQDKMGEICPTRWRTVLNDCPNLRLQSKMEVLVNQLQQCSLNSGSYKVKRVSVAALSNIYYQIVWTQKKAAIVFLPPREIFSQEDTNAYGFYTEDKEMLKIIQMLAHIAEETGASIAAGVWFPKSDA